MVGHRPYIYIYIYIARLIIEHHREWLASLANNIYMILDCTDLRVSRSLRSLANYCENLDLDDYGGGLASLDRLTHPSYFALKCVVSNHILMWLNEPLF